MNGLEKRIEQLEVQWQIHCQFHTSENPHALQEARYRASDAESHCKALAEDRSALRKEVERLRAILAEVPEDFNYNGRLQPPPEWFQKLRNAIDVDNVMKAMLF
jgi:hypothetical protein